MYSEPRVLPLELAPDVLKYGPVPQNGKCPKSMVLRCEVAQDAIFHKKASRSGALCLKTYRSALKWHKVST